MEREIERENSPQYAFGLALHLYEQKGNHVTFQELDEQLHLI